ncbi:2TM domain-containing protein [Zeaxanthinibacter enoshimensis]|uniref:2TM domain-containing protein n=1 Tax=Zeaxanthinibacter enoshimensis TaxID=392009 RepID=A0A4R6TJI7_9FLAO|nr:2TM domain-containing protein [Zeaxanthinibacter enoshimensis]TDQ29399.1 2TM domain-containing protein [Zeaxanthinibacter enoshimensis]
MDSIGKIFRAGLLIGFLITLVFMGIELIMGRAIELNDSFWTGVGYNFLYSVVLTFINASFFNYLNHKVKWGKYKRFRLWIGILGSILLTMGGIFMIRVAVEMTMGGETWSEFVATEKRIHYVIALIITLVASMIFHTFYFYKHWQESKVKEQQIIAGTASAKFDALKNQLDPHFLFNSLNVLTSLIEEDPKQAQNFTTSLSKVYRYILEQKHKDVVSLSEELQFAKTYVSLLKMRFEDSIVFEMPEEVKNPDAKLVPLSLQLLLENAVKHNVVTASRPLLIRVYEEDGVLVIANNLQPKQVIKKSSGVGLRNIRQRYEILSSRKMEIRQTADSFEVRLPLLTRKVTDAVSQETYIESKRYLKAKERVEAIKGFYGNLTAYCLVIPFLVFINYKTTTDIPWSLFSAVGWGIGLVFHASEAFGRGLVLGKKWEERKIQEFIQKDKS